MHPSPCLSSSSSPGVGCWQWLSSAEASSWPPSAGHQSLLSERRALSGLPYREDAEAVQVGVSEEGLMNVDHWSPPETGNKKEAHHSVCGKLNAAKLLSVCLHRQNGQRKPFPFIPCSFSPILSTKHPCHCVTAWSLSQPCATWMLFHSRIVYTCGKRSD